MSVESPMIDRLKDMLFGETFMARISWTD